MIIKETINNNMKTTIERTIVDKKSETIVIYVKTAYTEHGKVLYAKANVWSSRRGYIVKEWDTRDGNRMNKVN